MEDFSSVVITTDAGSYCVHCDVDDDIEQSLRRLLISVVYFLQLFKQKSDEITMEHCRIADDLGNQAEEFVRNVRLAYVNEK